MCTLLYEIAPTDIAGSPMTARNKKRHSHGNANDGNERSEVNSGNTERREEEKIKGGKDKRWEGNNEPIQR